MWLGNDMSGETYHSRIMSAAKARYAAEQAQRAVGAAPGGQIDNNSVNNNSPQQEQSSSSKSIDEIISIPSSSLDMHEATVTFPTITFPGTLNSVEDFSTFMEESMQMSASSSSGHCVLNVANVVSLEVRANLEEALRLSTSKAVVGVVNLSSSSSNGESASFAGLPVFNYASNNHHVVPPLRGAAKEEVTGDGDSIDHNNISTGGGVMENNSFAAAAPSRAQVHYGTVRSGQQVYAEKASLIIIGGVNDGGEVLADGDIHVYGPLKGRAVAGLGGGPDGADACVFARSFSPSLVGVNEVFIAPDDHAEAHFFIDREVVVRATGAKNFSTGVGGKFKSVDIDGVTISLLPMS
jgi:septum site-determining protein MinC